MTLTTCWPNVYFNVKHICITRNNATLSQIGNYAINFSGIVIETTENASFHHVRSYFASMLTNCNIDDEDLFNLSWKAYTSFKSVYNWNANGMKHIILACNTALVSLQPNHFPINNLVVLMLKWGFSCPWVDEVWLILNNQLTAQTNFHTEQSRLESIWGNISYTFCRHTLSERPMKCDSGLWNIKWFARKR